MATSSDMIDELRDLLDDDADSQVTFASKIRYLNRGLSAMFPKVFMTNRDSTLTYDPDVYEYTLTVNSSAGKILLVEIETDSTSDRYVRLDDYTISPGTPNSSGRPILVFGRQHTEWDGSSIRVTSAVPITAFSAANYTAAQSETYYGPEYTSQLPVFYAMSQIMSRILDRRMDFGRFSVQNQNATAGPIDIMSASQYWMDRFTQFLDQMQMPLPSSGI